MHADPEKDDAQLDKAIADSFPASDPPAATSPVTATSSTPQVPVGDAGTGTAELRIYRIIEPRHAEHPFSGAGSDGGGRWTSPRTQGVYASLSPATAMLEYLVHLEGDTPRELLLASASVPIGCVLAQVELPSEWPERPYRDNVRRIGDEWSKSCRSLVLRVPSAVVAGEHNVIVNPEHPDFVKLQLEKLTPVKLDSRLRF